MLRKKHHCLPVVGRSSLNKSNKKRRFTDLPVRYIWVGLVIFSLLSALLAWVSYRSFQPPPPKVCGTPGGPPVTAYRIQLSDGRYLAYKELGAPRETAKYKIIAVHGFGGSRHALLGGLSDEVIEELGIFIVGYDRAGYGQSTPNPQRNLKSEAYDVQGLADALGLGPKFYVAATSIGGYTGYALLKYLPHRLAGLAMFAPVTNFWWPGIPKEDAKKAWGTQAIGDRLALSVAHHAPWLLYWYMTQRVFPTSSTVKMERSRLSEMDQEVISNFYENIHSQNPLEPTQQGKFESQHRDMMVMFGKWEFDPGTLENPFVNSSVRVDIWQGDIDYLVPVILQRYVARSLPWVHYHEVPGEGHALLGVPGLADKMVKTMLLGHE
ncbi:hypothetical protein R1sor_018579 [Riccia sorocarpa]|uniref:AB hydrolase-1 domain-containing protein n=1 Tax=Riccia sorocarpa TaxID=122646 RepID=A0ABD3IE75_9MARC